MSPVLRGTVYKTDMKQIVSEAENSFGFAQIQLVSFEDLYAGKILAALDRQHPRDLFDIKNLLKNEGFTPKLKEAFIVYLISHNRRILEILNPSRIEIKEIFETDFQGMTTYPVKIDDLLEAREDLIQIIHTKLHKKDKLFLLGFKNGNPDWDYFNVPHIKELPAVKWKQHNLKRMRATERKKMIDALQSYFKM